jgi:tripartite-type tricarboxylate transporter receptor subunit TctC
MADERVKAFPDIPTLKELGIDWSLGTWRGIAGPKGLPDDIVNVLEPALKKAVESERFTSFMDQVGYGVAWIPTDEAVKFLAENDEGLGNLMKELGLAK